MQMTETLPEKDSAIQATIMEVIDQLEQVVSVKIPEHLRISILFQNEYEKNVNTKQDAVYNHNATVKNGSDLEQ